MAQDETPIETPLKMLRQQVIEKIQKQSRDARQQTQADVAEGATTEPPQPTAGSQTPPYIVALESISPGAPADAPVEQEYSEGEA